MSNHYYDNWERLVDAVLRREKDRYLASSHYRSPSCSSSDGSSSSSSVSGSPFHDHALEYVPSQLLITRSQAAHHNPGPKRELVDISGAVLDANIHVLLRKLLSVPIEEINLVWGGFSEDLQRLNGSLLMIRDCLSHRNARIVNNDAVKRWLMKIEHVAFDADYLLDEFKYELLRRQVEYSQNKTKRKVMSLFSTSIIPIAFRRKMAPRIRDINKNLQLIATEASSFGLRVRSRLLTDASDPRIHEFLERPSQQIEARILDPVIVGRGNDMEKIVEMLTIDPIEQLISVIPIVGVGGLGKTTLARLVFYHDKINTRFEKKMWVHTSQNVDDDVVLFEKMLDLLIADNSRVTASRASILTKLQQHLAGKRYLLVLDNLHFEESEKWDNFMHSLSRISSMKGNGIIVVTRSDKVASTVKTLPVHYLGALSEDQCWFIMKQKAFRGRDVPIEFEAIGKNMAKMCRGLPSLANLLGSVLFGKMKSKWLMILDSLSNLNGDENTLLMILRWFFDTFPSSLKKCFAYFSSFPKDVQIEKEQLIELWMAEGFLQNDKGNHDMETDGDILFNHLLQISVFQDVKRDFYGNITHCKMHNPMHDLALLLEGSKSINVMDNSSDSKYGVQYVAMNSIGYEQHSLPHEQAKYLHTLFFKGSVAPDMFLNLKRLHVLNLAGANLKQLPSSIGKLIHLRYLDFSYTKIDVLPKSVGKLYNLQTLRTELSSLKKLPSTAKHLISLRHLHIQSIPLPAGIGRLTCLRTLPYFMVGDEKGCRIGELKSLNNLRGKLEISNLEKVKDKQEAEEANLSQKTNIYILKLVWNKSRDREAKDHQVLEGLQPHPKLKSLEIEGFKNKSFPLWTMKMAVRRESENCWVGLTNLMDVTLSYCEFCEETPALGQLPNLKSLKLNNLHNVGLIGLSFYGISEESSASCVKTGKKILFPSLKKLELDEMPNLTVWTEAETTEATAFPYLESLRITNCPRLRCAPRHFPSLKELEISGVASRVPLSNICSSSNSLIRLKSQT